MTEQAEIQGDAIADSALSQALRQATREAHERVDQAMMSLAPFADHAGYRRFLAVQYHFHRVSRPLYRQPELAEWLPGLAERCRYEDVAADCRDLELDASALAPPASAREPAIDTPYRALGWLYTNEGSNLGAAILFKHACGMGFSADHGARHLAERGEGRARHWREFVAQLDALPLTDSQREQAEAGARDAFGYVEALAAALR